MSNPQVKLSELIEELPLRFKAAQVVEGMMIGIHHSPFHGFSSEFAQHRAYQPGDDLRYFDWKVWARNEKKFVRQFNEETNLLSTIVLDCSESMAFPESGQSKWNYASVLSASLIHLLLKQRDAVGLILSNHEIEKHINPKTYSWYESHLFSAIENTTPHNKTNLSDALKRAASVHTRRGLIIIVSDFMLPIETIDNEIKFLRSQNHDVMCIQVLDRSEIFLPDYNDIKIRDMETMTEIQTNLKQLQTQYLTEYENWIAGLTRFFRNNQIGYFRTFTNEPFSVSLREILQIRNRIH